MLFKYGKYTFDIWHKRFIKDLIFISVSGSHAYGWSKEDSDLDLRLVWIPSLLQALSVMHRGRVKHYIRETEIGNIDVTTYPIHHFCKLLIKGNGNALENLFQEKVYCDESKVRELQKIVLKNLHLKFLKHYLGYYQSLKNDMSIPSRLKKYGIQKLILNSCRVLRAGIILAKRKKVVYNLLNQDKYHASRMYHFILDDYFRNRESTKKDIADAKLELKFLELELKKYVEGIGWYNIFPSIAFDRWIYNHLVE